MLIGLHIRTTFTLPKAYWNNSFQDWEMPKFLKLKAFNLASLSERSPNYTKEFGVTKTKFGFLEIKHDFKKLTFNVFETLKL